MGGTKLCWMGNVSLLVDDRGPGWASQIAEYFVTHHLSIHLSPISKFSQFIAHNDDGDIDE